MIKIALCDDESSVLDHASQKINQVLRNLSVSASLAAFTKPSVLTASAEDGERFDIYVLDVEMPELDGFQTAEKIRVFQPNAVLIFLTSHIEFATEGYKVEAIRYIPKLNMETALPEAIEKAVVIAQRSDSAMLMVQHYQQYTRVMCRDILYVQKLGRSVQITTSQQGTLKDNRSIKDLLQAVSDPRFVLVDRSCFVNLNYVRELLRDGLIMSNGDRLPVSRSALPKVKEAILGLWGGGL